MSTIDWLPTSSDVAAVLRARTKDDTGRELGDWSDATRPTSAEVDVLIAQAADFVAAAIGGVPDRCAASAKSATLLRAAMLVELSYFPEQVRSDRSPYPELKELYDSAQESALTCVTEGGAGGGTEGGEGFTYHSLPIVPETLANAYDVGWRNPEYPRTWQQPLFAPTPAEPANIDEPDTLAPPIQEIVVGHPPIITQQREDYPPPSDSDGD